MANHYNYDSIKHDLIVAGIRVSDYSDDVKISIEYAEDFRTVTMGVDGASSTNERHNRNATIKFNILQTSPLNAKFGTLALSEKEFTVAHVDRNFTGDIGGFASVAHFTKIPTLEVGGDSKGREWIITAIDFKPSLNIK